ncbi:MAG: monovalent cation/H+ antiporter complex subunit F [Pirellulales bacterium]|jgi:multicomponent Na+:H+ antiporter subunit F
MNFLLAAGQTNIPLSNNYALAVTSGAILVTMVLALIRAMLGPTVFDRVLALNMFGTKTVLLICVIGFLTERTDFLDLALLYSLMNFIGMVALLRFSEYGSFREEGADIGSSAKL